MTRNVDGQPGLFALVAEDELFLDVTEVYKTINICYIRTNYEHPLISWLTVARH